MSRKEKLTDKEIRHLFSILNESVKKTPYEKEILRNLRAGLRLVRSL